ncbi:phosphoenolpyruvate--protein phosphotransferase [Acidiphilium iwatense]|uniref:Phosphoenolpyruvate--protein phosphotransferase n=1 Tax=Acidiphilium iwatense TaxID=768198 RepID=A0ABS9E0K3_9PROT|nr:phosphoenolpyruvate--protein phosphotransferase [Acidiphilium iwatense]MCF3947868.1 phosphoenolpyruvate--protein phosphotransferase [Acidiphilium iwatense]
MSAKVALVLVSHSRVLAEAVATLIRPMTGPDLKIACAAGAGDDGAELGTDATAILAAIEDLDSPAGTLVLMDIGSALLSAETALDLLDAVIRSRVSLCAAPFVEGAIAAGVAAAGGAQLDTVRAEAEAALESKRAQLGLDSAQTTPQPANNVDSVTREVRIADPAGLHLRPAAAIARLAQAQAANVTLAPADGSRVPAPATSLTALLGLGARGNATLRLSASGAGAEAALDVIEAVLTAPTQEPEPPEPVAATGPRPASPGIAIGPMRTLRTTMPPIARSLAKDRDAAKRALDAALGTAKRQGGAGHAILDAQRALLDDPALRAHAIALTDRDGLDAAPAWAEAIEAAASTIAALDNPILRARAADLRDAGALVLRALGVTHAAALPDGPPAILIADDLLPSLAVTLDRDRVPGVIDRAGGTASHAAILLRAAGIPYLVGAGATELKESAIVAFDGATGEFWLDPDAATLAMLRAREAQAARDEAASRSNPVRLADGSDITLWANVASRAEAEAADRANAAGIGLLRTEFLFLDRVLPPSEDEQCAMLRAIMAPMRGRPIVLRTLDAGADKPMPFLPLAPEQNPALGVRGLRALLDNDAIFETQLRAMLRAGVDHDARIMLPMVTNPSEVTAARAILNHAHEALAGAKTDHAWPVRLGIMIEVPAAALVIADFADIIDFVSIGTNDLTQYTLAADRNVPALAGLGGTAHPSVLALCRKVAAEARVPVSVCGEAAGDPEIAPLLASCGIRNLSTAPRSFAAIRKIFD